MKACRTASLLAAVPIIAVFAANGVGACHERSDPEVPPVTVARPNSPPVLDPEGVSIATDATVPRVGEPNANTVLTAALKEPPVSAVFVDAPASLAAQFCTRLLISVVKGKIAAAGETLAPGDVLVVENPPVSSFKLEGAGVAVVVTRDLSVWEGCSAIAKPMMSKTVIRATTAPKLEWAGGTMSAHLDVAPLAPLAPPARPATPAPSNGANGVAPVSPTVYLGRLEGTAPVAEHTHAGSWEIIAAVEANGTFVIDGTEGRLGARQIVMIPPGARHAWKPEPGSKLVAVQLYSPPGPEQRFVTLAAARDAGPR